MNQPLPYVPLHLHSQYSILDSTLSPEAIVTQAEAFGLKSVALTDFCNMYGVVDFTLECKAKKIKPIIGIEIMVAPDSRKEKQKVFGKPAGHPLILLAKNREGYKNLCKLSSLAFLEGFYYYPRIDEELLKEHAKGLICLSGPYYGKVGSLITQEETKELEATLDFYQSLFGEDYYLEISRHKMSEENLQKDGVYEESWLYQKFKEVEEKQEKIIEKAREIGSRRGIRTVATGDVRYLHRDDWQAHEILMNVSSGEAVEIWERDAFGNPKNKTLNPKRQTSYSHELYFKSPQEMSTLFADFPEALTNTELISNQCEFTFDFSQKFYPVFVPPALEGKEYSHQERLSAAETYLKTLCKENIEKRYPPEALAKVQEKYPDKEALKVVEERLTYELDIIISKGMCDYLLIVHDFISWAKNHKIPVGPGRGSGAGSIILYLIGITDIEPLRFNLFFERFINPERISYPDIDVDICMDRRPEVINYTINKYGKDRVAQIITFGTMKAKMAIKDVARVLSIPLAKVNELAKLIPEDPGITIAKALELDADLNRLYREDEEVKRLFDLSQKVEGSIRNTGIHAAGLIICGDSLTDHIPICNAKDNDLIVTQFSMKPVEKVGMLKIDFLGLKTLTSIQKTVDAIEASQGVKIDWVNLPLDDEKTFALLNHGKTSGVFQLESSGMQDLARQLHIDKFEEIIAVGALYRPGPMEMIPSFIQRKHGKEEISYDHEWLKDILQETYGIMVYQEQVMQMASRLAGYSLGEGDVLRRAMGKKDREEMARQRDKFKEGARAKGISEELAVTIFDKVEKFASYGFNKSHAAAYGYLSYVTGYLKANYPGEWMAALMTCDLHDITKVAKHIRECQSMHLEILPPDINESKLEFVAKEKGIRFALAAIKGIGEGVVTHIIAERERGGLYTSLANFLERVDSAQVGKKVIENLIEAGAFDSMGWTRKQHLVFLDENFASIQKEIKEKARGILDLFAMGGDEVNPFHSKAPPPVLEEAQKLDILKKEKELLGFYVTGHPLKEYSSLIESLKTTPLEEFENLPDQTLVKAVFVLDTLQVKISAKTQKKFAILVISNGVERYELPIWSELFDAKSEILDENKLYVGILQIDKREEALRLGCKWIEDLANWNDEKGKKLEEVYEQTAKNLHGNGRKRKEFKGKEQGKMQKEEIRVKAVINVEKITMKKILELKEILREHAGGDAIDLHFQSSDRAIGVISIDASCGVKYTPELREKILNLPYGVDLICEK